MDKLLITNLKDIKITKVKNWAIYFNVGTEKYLLHESSEDFECLTTLYHRIPLENEGCYRLEPICSPMSHLPNCISFLNRKTKVYSQINVIHFVKRLTFDGYFEGIYSKEVADLKENINKKKELVRLLEQDIQAMYSLI